MDTSLVLGLVSALGVPTIGGIGWYIKSMRDERVADKLDDLTTIKDLRKQIFDLQQERIQYEITRRESSDKTMQVLGDLVTYVKGVAAAKG